MRSWTPWSEGGSMILVAPDKFAGSASAVEAAAAIEQGLREGGVEGPILRMPIADGGEGTLEVLRPIRVRRVSEGRVATLPDGRAFVEAADAIGRATRATDSAPLGRLLLAALQTHPAVVVGLGGSRTWDLGEGLLPLVRGRVAGRLELWCDVMAPLLGPDVDARSFLAQKGVNTIHEVEQRWRRLVEEHRLDPSLPGGGAAGGLGLMLAHLGGVAPCSGAERVLAALGFDEALAGASLVITGEGRFDRQSLAGKGPGLVLRRGRGSGVPCVVLAGSVEPGLDAVAVSDPSLPLSEQLARGLQSLRRAAAGLAGSAG